MLFDISANSRFCFDSKTEQQYQRELRKTLIIRCAEEGEEVYTFVQQLMAEIFVRTGRICTIQFPSPPIKRGSFATELRIRVSYSDYVGEKRLLIETKQEEARVFYGLTWKLLQFCRLFGANLETSK